MLQKLFNNKLIILPILILTILVFLGWQSLTLSRKNAEQIADSFKGNISPLRAQFVLVKDDKICVPYWIFRGEYEDLITGASFDVEISLFGKVLKKPPSAKQ